MEDPDAIAAFDTVPLLEPQMMVVAADLERVEDLVVGLEVNHMTGAHELGKGCREANCFG